LVAQQAAVRAQPDHRAVRSRQRLVEGDAVRLALQQPRAFPTDSARVLAELLEEAAARRLVSLATQQLASRLVQPTYSSVASGDQHAERCMLEGRKKPTLVRQQPLLGKQEALARTQAQRDVLRGADEPARPPAGIPLHLRPELEVERALAWRVEPAGEADRLAGEARPIALIVEAREVVVRHELRQEAEVATEPAGLDLRELQESVRPPQLVSVQIQRPGAYTARELRRDQLLPGAFGLRLPQRLGSANLRLGTVKQPVEQRRHQQDQREPLVGVDDVLLVLRYRQAEGRVVGQDDPHQRRDEIAEDRPDREPGDEQRRRLLHVALGGRSALPGHASRDGPYRQAGCGNGGRQL